MALAGLTMRILDRIALVIVLFLGVGHVVATPKFAPGLTEATAWFSGSGLALFFAGLLNLVRLRAKANAPWRICLVANLLTLAWIGLIVAVFPVAQAFFAAGAVLIMTIGGLVQRRAVRAAVG
jgi:hypothetical protein